MGHHQKFYTNQIYSSSLLSQLAYMWKNEVLCDAVIRSGVTCVKAHRVLLIASCPMLQSMESSTVGSQLEVRLAADIKEKSIYTFLQYLYEGFMLLTEDNCRDIEKIGRLLQVDSVIQCCADFHKSISSRMNVTDTSDFYRFGFHGNQEFRHVRSSDVLTTHGSDVPDQALRNFSSLRSSKAASYHSSDFTKSSDSSHKRESFSHPMQSSDCKKKRFSQDKMPPTHFPLHHESSRQMRKSFSSNQSREQRALSSTNDGDVNLAEDCILPVTEEGVVNLVEDSIQILETNSTGDHRQSSVGVNIISSTSRNSSTEILNLGLDRGFSTGPQKKVSEENAITGYCRKDTSQISDVNTGEDCLTMSGGKEHYPEENQHLLSGPSDTSQVTVSHDLSNMPATQCQETLNTLSQSETTSQHTEGSPGTDLSQSSNGLSVNNDAPALPVSHSTNSNHLSTLSATQKHFTSETKVSKVGKSQNSSSSKYEDRRPGSSLSAESIDLTIVKHEPADNQCKYNQNDRPVEFPHQTFPHLSRDNPSSLSLMLPPLQQTYPSSTLPFPTSYFALSGSTAGMLPLAMARRRSMEDSMGEKGENHRMVYITNRKPCVWCQMNRVKTKSGWYCYASYKCVKCDVPLCKQGRDCFMEYHKHIGVSSDDLICIE